MKLYSATASPFARKARICIHELGLEARVALVDPGAVTPVTNNAAVNAANPLGMIPVLITDDGDALMDSRVICEYLNDIGSGNLIPQARSPRYQALKLQALADGVMDLAVALRYETAIRPTDLHWPEWQASQHEKIARVLALLNRQCGKFESSPTIGEISVAAALGYLDFRFPDTDWRAANPALTDWFDTVANRPSIAQTAPL